MSYASASSVLADVSRMFVPAPRIPVHEAAERWVRFPGRGGGVVGWSGAETPYMREPMALLASRKYEAVVFIGPAQSGKTQALIDCWLGYTIMCQTWADLMVIQATETVARDYSKVRLKRTFRHSPELAACKSPSRHDDNTTEVTMRSGQVIRIRWPSENNLQGMSIPYLALTDYDRMPRDLGGQGSPFELARKRARKYLSRGMTLAESSPGYDVSDPHWSPSTPHEAPPADGIFGLYNLGDRRRLYWPCTKCGTYWMQPPGPEGFRWEAQADLFGTGGELAGEVYIVCPACDHPHHEAEKKALVARSIWVPEGMRPKPDGTLEGTPRSSTIASFWLPGAAAVYQGWRPLIVDYLRAVRQYEATGREDSLRTSIMADFAAPYVPRARMDDRRPEDLESRAEDIGKRVVPADARYLVATIDVQGNRFVVQVHGRTAEEETYIVDRFDIRWSKRRYRDEASPIDPGAHPEDWALIEEQVIDARYPIAESGGWSMGIAVCLCDSGGRAGVSTNAYAFWRRMRAAGKAKQFHLVKGEDTPPERARHLYTLSWPDNQGRPQRTAAARGDVPLLLVNTTLAKDSVNAKLGRTEPGPGRMRFPDWLGSWFYRELIAEVRTERGWKPSGRSANEGFDLLAYAELAESARLLAEANWNPKAARHFDWSAPPAWALDRARNPLVRPPVTGRSNSPAPRTATVKRKSASGFERDGWAL